MEAFSEQEREAIAKGLAKAGVGTLRRHLFLCTGPKCCEDKEGAASWEYLKRRVGELGIDRGPNATGRTKVGCLRVCAGGPVGVVYPEGVWYGHLTPENIERVLVEHVIGGREIAELVIARGELGG